MKSEFWRTSTLLDSERWFRDIGLSQKDAVEKARGILERAEMAPDVLEGALQWDEFVWSVCNDPDSVQRWQSMSASSRLSNRASARSFVMAMTS